MPENKTKRITQMFDAIAFNYDRLNHLFTFNIDKRWRRKAIRQFSDIHKGVYMDLACGTGDMMVELIKQRTPSHLVGVDLSANMMEIGKEKVMAVSGDCAVEFRLENCEILSAETASVDGITIAFGIRNVEHPQAALLEMYRTLKLGGEVIILELSRPERRIVRWGSDLYFHKIVPVLGGVLSRHPSAYSYLPKSVVTFPSGETFLNMMQEAGFVRCSRKKVLGGIATIYKGIK